MQNVIDSCGQQLQEFDQVNMMSCQVIEQL